MRARQGSAKNLFFQQTFPVRLYAGHWIAVETEEATGGLSLYTRAEAIPRMSNSSPAAFILLSVGRIEGREER